MKTLKHSILLILTVLSVETQAKVVQLYDDQGNPTVCEIDSGELTFIKGLCPGTTPPPWSLESDDAPMPESFSFPMQSYDDYGNPDGCWGEKENPKLPLVYIGEVCPFNALYFDKFTCTTANSDKVEVYLHHLRLTQVYVYGFGGVFFNAAVNLPANEIPVQLELFNAKAMDSQVDQVKFTYSNQLTNLSLPLSIQGTSKGSDTEFITEVNCLQNY